MLSKYTFLAPNLIRVRGEGADYAHLITSASLPRILRPTLALRVLDFLWTEYFL